MEPERIEADITEYLRREIGVPPDLPRDEPLFTSGVIDSFDLVHLLAFLRERYGLEISPLEVSLENFDSVARLTRYVASRAA
jgi:acyl carrier protein/D-alanine--poly(phosphoribitol) ligase subunit 2